MGSFVNTLFRGMLGWLQGIVSAVWSAFTSDGGESFFSWIGKYWLPIAALLCIIGLISDLGVYIVRWKPYKVWKSFFSRKKVEEAVPERRPLRTEAPARRREPVFPENRVPHTDTEPEAAEDKPEPEPAYPETDYTRAEPVTIKEEIYAKPTEAEASVPVTVTPAGYRVPADSPYRRPQVDAALQQEQPAETVTGRQETGKTQPVVYRRRRRLNVSELVGDPEEELRSFDAPQNVINSQEAYHNPVYPRGWKRNEEGKNE